jgi:signal transduction histidine kinase
VVPAFVGGLIVAFAIAGFFASRAITRGPSEAEVESTASATGDAIAARLNADGRLLLAASASIAGDAKQPPPDLRAALRTVASLDRLLGVAQVNPAKTTLVVTVPNNEAYVGMDLSSQPQWSLALDLARDRAGPGAVVASGTDGQPAVLDVLPLYGAAEPPSDIGARRAAVQGFAVTITPIATITGLPTDRGSEIAVRVVDGPTVLAARGKDSSRPPDNPATASITQNGVAWTVQAWATPSASSLPWAVLIGGLVLAAIVGAIVVSRERSIASAAAETDARNQELALIARTGPLLQQSLALGDLLPLFVVEVSDELALDAVSISLCADSGEMVRVFALGVGANQSVASIDALSSPPPTAAPGDIVTIPLIRVSRVVGAFQARAITGLTEPQMNTLTSVCALLAAAIGNVRLFQDEQEMVTRLRDLDRMKTRFIGSVSHELRTSVTAIQGFAGLLETGATKYDAATRADYAERIGRNARSLAVLIEDLLDFARFERSGLAADLHPIDLSELVPNVVDQVSSVLAGRKVSMVIEPGVIAMADSLAIERVLANLLSNAGKYTPADSEVVVALERGTENAVLSVIDHGPGVAEAERDKIFELFYRSDESARVTRGVGIGLALTRQLVDHLNGTIAVDDAPGGGARFRVTIPLADDALTAAQATSTATHLRSGG